MWDFIIANPFVIIIAYLLLMSIITFALYGSDKRRAIRKMRRISEKTLLTMSAIGGAVGGWAAMMIFRHKTRGEHWYFTAVNVGCTLVHIAAVIVVAILV